MEDGKCSLETTRRREEHEEFSKGAGESVLRPKRDVEVGLRISVMNS